MAEQRSSVDVAADILARRLDLRRGPDRETFNALVSEMRAAEAREQQAREPHEEDPGGSR